MDNKVGQVLRERRLELGMTQEEIALELGMSIHQYQRYEYGEHRLANCPMKIGLRICAVLELDPFEVVFDNGISYEPLCENNCAKRDFFI